MHGSSVPGDIQAAFDELDMLVKRHKQLVTAVEQYLRQGPISVTRRYIYENMDRRACLKTNERGLLGTEMIYAGRALGERSLYGNELGWVREKM